jgi:phosphoribosyl-dephospho-CoA transferase
MDASSQKQPNRSPPSEFESGLDDENWQRIENLSNGILAHAEFIEHQIEIFELMQLESRTGHERHDAQQAQQAHQTRHFVIGLELQHGNLARSCHGVG